MRGTAYTLVKKTDAYLFFQRWSEPSVPMEKFFDAKSEWMKLEKTDAGYYEITTRGDPSEFIGVFIPDDLRDNAGVIIHIGFHNLAIRGKVFISDVHFSERVIIPDEMLRPCPHLCK